MRTSNHPTRQSGLPGSHRRPFLITLIGCLLAAFASLAAPQAGDRTVHLVVVAGQSNAEGYNHLGQFHGGREPFPADLRDQPRVLFWPGLDDLPPGENRWTHLQVRTNGGFGPEISLGADLQAACPGTDFGIVKYASGGTGIARSVDYADYIPALAGFDDRGRHWHPPTAGRPAGQLYEALLRNFRAATTHLERQGRRWQLDGFIWMQGEHEAGISARMAADYRELLTAFIGAVRRDLAQPNLPFVFGQVNSHTWVYGDTVRAHQAEVMRSDPMALLVPTIDLPRVPGDASHFTADGMLTLGSRFTTGLMALSKNLRALRKSTVLKPAPPPFFPR